MARVLSTRNGRIGFLQGVGSVLALGLFILVFRGVLVLTDPNPLYRHDMFDTVCAVIASVVIIVLISSAITFGAAAVVQWSIDGKPEIEDRPETSKLKDSKMTKTTSSEIGQ